jgi:[acyl-carrier-protein] S-malonyltransferase
MVACLFAGQGSQYIGMGSDLYEAFPESKAVFAQADEILGFPLSRLCFEGPQEELTRTQNCQPAILTVSVAAFSALSAQRSALSVAYAAGLSLGEYSALVAAGALSFEDALYLVRRRGEFMEEEAGKFPGGMLSVIGLNLAQVREICLKTHTEIANLNCPGQVVISGAKEKIAQAHELAQGSHAKMAVLLEVSGAFHSSLMRGASARLAAEINKVKIKPPKIPVVSNVTARPVSSAQEIRDNLIQQVSSSVLWEDSMRFILSKGVKNFLEFGPGKVLKGLMRRIEPAAEVRNIEKKEDVFWGGRDALKG